MTSAQVTERQPRGDRLPDSARCTWVKVNGERCKEARDLTATELTELCHWHRDNVKRRVQAWNRSEVIADIPLEEHLSMELRMSTVQLKELEFQVLDLGLNEPMWHHESEELEVREGADPKNSYTSSKRAASLGAHPVLVQFLKEREHHMNVVKTCVAAGLAAKQVAIIERYVESLISAQMTLAQALGHDPNDAATRGVIMETIKKQQMELQDVSPRTIEG